MTRHDSPCFDCDDLIAMHRAGIPHCACGSPTWPCASPARYTTTNEAKFGPPPCGHRRCSPDECYKLPPEEVDPTPADITLGEQLVAEGWMSTSTRHRTIARWKNQPPKIEDMLLPEYRDSPFGRRFIARYGEWYGPSLRDSNPEFEPFIERRKLTLPQFRAFKKAGGRIS